MICSFHLGIEVISLDTTSGISSVSCIYNPFLASLSAQSFPVLLLCPLTLCNFRSRFLALQHSCICLSKLWFFALNQLRNLLSSLYFSIASIVALLSVYI